MLEIENLEGYDTLFVGLSGGLDSTVLLHLLVHSPISKEKIHAIHINHGLSPHANFWQMHCESVCHDWRIQLSVHHVTVRTSNLEADARAKRYAVFASKLPKHGACVLLGHHKDDLVETFFLHLVRGSGLKGLCGIHEKVIFSENMLLRPLLRYSRAELEDYARRYQLIWVEDESNQNRHFSRNYLRHEVLPVMQEKWPQASQKIYECTQHLQDAQSNLYALAEIDCPALKNVSTVLHYESFLHLNKSRIINIIMTWLHYLGVSAPSSFICNRIIHELIHVGADKTPIVAWGKHKIQRYDGAIYLRSLSDNKKISGIWQNFPEPFELDESDVLIAEPTHTGIYVPPGACVEIRYRKGGEKLKIHQCTRTLKKLFQEYRVPPWLRDELPLVYVNHVLVSVVDFWASDPYDEAKVPYVYHIKRRKKGETI